MMKKVKILYLITGLNTGGAEIILENLLKKLDKKKFLPLVVSIKPIGEVGCRIAKQGIKVLSLDAKIKYNLLLFFRLFRIIKNEKPRIIHTHLFHANFLGRLIGKFCKVPIIISTVHSINLGGFKREFLLKITDKFCQVTVVVSGAVGQIIKQKNIASHDKIRIIYNGIDMDRFFLTSGEIEEWIIIKNHQPLLVAVGRLTQAKGYQDLIKAIKNLKIKYKNIALLILGEGEDRKKLDLNIKNLNLEKNIFLLGNKRNVADYLKVADIFVLSSLWEGMPTAVLEAMACGLPTVCCKAGGVVEIIEDKKDGFLIDSNNSNNIAETIEQVLQISVCEKEKIARQAKKKVKNFFSAKIMTQNYEKLYKEFLKNYG